MNKMTKGINCAYCGKWSKKTKDHVVASAFYNENNKCPDNISPIIVPACQPCNNNKGKDESYMAIMMRIASNIDLTEKQLRGIKKFTKKQKEFLANAERKFVKINGIYQDVLLPKIDCDTFDKVIWHIAVGLVYEFCGKQPPIEKFSKIIYSWMDIDYENQINYLLSLDATTQIKKFSDNGRFDNKVKYGLLASDQHTIVYVSINNPLMFLNNNKQSRVAAISFSN